MERIRINVKENLDNLNSNDSLGKDERDKPNIKANAKEIRKDKKTYNDCYISPPAKNCTPLRYWSKLAR